MQCDRLFVHAAVLLHLICYVLAFTQTQHCPEWRQQAHFDPKGFPSPKMVKKKCLSKMLWQKYSIHNLASPVKSHYSQIICFKLQLLSSCTLPHVALNLGHSFQNVKAAIFHSMNVQYLSSLFANIHYRSKEKMF